MSWLITAFFFNYLVNSYGKPFKCLQRAIKVSAAKDVAEASEKQNANLSNRSMSPIGNTTLNS